MYIIDNSKILQGDVILTRSSSRESELIRKSSNSEYSHAILYVGESSCIESDGLGVQAQNLQRLLFESSTDVKLLRLRMGREYIPYAIDFARQKIGTEYSTSEARLVNSGKGKSAMQPNRQFCTRFIAQAYESAGVSIVSSADYCSPQDILDSELLEIVDDIVLKANEEQIKFASSDNPLERQTNIHNHLLESARGILNDDIQNFEQLAHSLASRPEKDSDIADILRDSGYLEMWKWDIAKNPWSYDVSALPSTSFLIN